MAKEPLIDRLVGTVLGTVGMVLQRMLVHFLGLLAAFFLVDASFGTGLFDEIGLKISVYAGVICLLPYGSVKNPYWWIPVASGCVQGALLAVLGVPAPLFLFWAGLQTWTLRLLVAKGRAGWDWVAAPVLAIGLYAYLSRTLLWGLPMTPLATWAGLSLIGLAAYRINLRANHRAVHRQLLASLLVRLRRLVGRKGLPPAEARYCSLLLGQLERLAAADALSDEHVDRAQDVVARLEDAAGRRAANPLGGLFKSAQWQHLANGTTPASSSDPARDLRELVTLLGEVERNLNATQGADSATSRDERRLVELEVSGRALLDKTATLPRELGSPVERVGFLSLDMVESMRRDASDRRQGLAFLGRYLPRVHSVVDEYIALGQGADTSRTSEVLGRVAAAFAEEKERMLRNDTMNFTAEVEALDTLLRMRGH